MFSPAYKRYALAMIVTVYTVNLFDRGLMVMLLQPIKEDLHLSDTQLGFVTGIAFALLYATLGVPIARWADRGNRVTITSLAIGLWGLTAMTCAFVTSYVQLLLARIAAGVGDAGCQPPMYSLLGDYFPEAGERTRAMYIWDMSSPLAGVISFMAAGWLNELYGWRLTFLLIGIPGLILTVLFKWTIVEPRTRANPVSDRAPHAPLMRAVLATLWHRRTCRHLTIAMIALFTMGQGLGPWYAAFMMRSHDMGTAELGVWLGIVLGASGIIGLLLGSYVVGRWFNGNEPGQLRMGAVTALLSVPCLASFLLLPDKHFALMALIPQSLLLFSFLSPLNAFLQRLVPDEMRATIFAVVMFLANLIAAGVGPQLVGILSDLLTPMLGNDGLRYAMLLVSFVAVWAAYHLWRAGQTISEDLSQAAHRVQSNPDRAEVPCPIRQT